MGGGEGAGASFGSGGFRNTERSYPLEASLKRLFTTPNFAYDVKSDGKWMNSPHYQVMVHDVDKARAMVFAINDVAKRTIEDPEMRGSFCFSRQFNGISITPPFRGDNTDIASWIDAHLTELQDVITPIAMTYDADKLAGHRSNSEAHSRNPSPQANVAEAISDGPVQRGGNGHGAGK